MSKFHYAGGDANLHSKIAVQRFVGQIETGTVIKLKDGCFGNENKAAIDFIKMTGILGEAAGSLFPTEVANLTIDIGKGNPGATGLIYTGSNTGVMRKVTIRSSDPERRNNIGLDLTLAHGPAYFKDITIEGFDIRRIERRSRNIFSSNYKLSTIINHSVSLFGNILYVSCRHR